MNIARHTAFFCALGAVLAGTWMAYAPGLHGTFLFDDFINLPGIGAFGPVDNATVFWRYITSGTADPVGRPLSLLSFLIDARDWPASAFGFKRTNLILHLINGLLLVALLSMLGRALGKTRQHAGWAALVAGAFWLLHPLFVSTTLYVVQREAMLPATFVLAGLIGYCTGRSAAQHGNRPGLALAAGSVIAGTLLATLSKANGILLPLLAWIIEATVFRRDAAALAGRGLIWMRRLVLVVPSLLFFAYLGTIAWHGFVDGVPAVRPWTLGERLLTEARILVDYLGSLWVPRAYTRGLFNDAFPVSTGILSPPSTLLSLIAIAFLLGWSWYRRREHPAFSASIWFFFGGHLLESTVVPLELYFEHRNYVPALLMFWPLALWLCEPRTEGAAKPSLRAPGHSVRMLIAVVLVVTLGCLTRLGADLWGNVEQQALVWAYKNPNSARAQAYAAQVELSRSQPAAAVARLDQALRINPSEIQLSLNMIGAKCDAQALTQADIDRAATALRTAPNTGRLGYDWFERALSMISNKSCAGLDLEVLDYLLAAAAANTKTQLVPGRLQDRLHLQGRIALLRGDASAAQVFFDRALDADPQPGAALQQAAILASAAKPELALRHLDHLASVWVPTTRPGLSMASLHNWLLWKQGYWDAEIRHLRNLIEEDVRTGSGPASAPPVQDVEAR